MNRRGRRLISLCFAALLLPAVGAAQDTVMVRGRGGGRLDAGSRVARRAVALFNDAETTRVFGSLTIGTDDVYAGDVAVQGGPVRVSGVIHGDLVAINADVYLRSTAEVFGDIVVLGGTLVGRDRARVTGNTTRYRSRALIRRSGDRLVLEREPRTTVRSRPARRFTRSADFSLVVNIQSYNRVEGLPLRFGPRISWGESFTETRGFVEGLGIVRTAGDLDNSREDLGYSVRGEVEFGRQFTVAVGGRAYDHVVPIEAWTLRDDEIGLASFLWHRDYRDYFLQRGVAGYVRIRPLRELTLTGQVARNEESSIAARDPWTPFRNDDIWRPNPVIDEGDFTAISAALEYDSRPSRHSGRSGWFLRAEWERGRSDNVTERPLPLGVRDPFPTDRDAVFDRVFVDLRRYLRVGPGQLRLRALGAGNVGGGDGPLPVQRRLSLGGPDPMPGFEFRQFACNAGVFDASRPALCDRLVLFQAEYRGSLSFSTSSRDRSRRHEAGRPWDDWDWGEWFWFDGPTIVLFGNAGTGWLDGQEVNDLDADVGAGLEIGSFGLYASKAVTEDLDIKLSLRIHRRF